MVLSGICSAGDRMNNSLFGFDLFGSLSGYVGDARAMSETEIANWQASQMLGARQAKWPLSYLQGLAQYQPHNQRPLDERFADFKVRLAAALDRFNQIKANQRGS
jgi:hypothetical protein